MCQTKSSNKQKPYSGSRISPGSFLWTDIDQSNIISSYYWGYTILQIPAGILSIKYSPRYIYVLSVLFSSLFTLLTPTFAYLGSGFLIALRFFLGLSQGIYYTGMYALAGKWIIREESTILLSIICSASSMGIVASQFLSGVIADNMRWIWIFYSMGSVMLIFSVTYWFMITEYPSQHKFISETELALLSEKMLKNKSGSNPLTICELPFKKILKSIPLWGICIAKIAFHFTWYVMINSLPYYVGLVLGYPLTSIGIISSLPYLVYFVGNISGGFISKFIQNWTKMTDTHIRKFMICTFLVLAAISQSCITLTGCSIALSMTFICATMLFHSLGLSVAHVNSFDLAPTISGLICTIPNFVSNMMGFVTPYVKSFYTQTGETRENWSKLFLTSAAILLVGAISFLFMGSGDVQEWDPAYNNRSEECKPLLDESEE